MVKRIFLRIADIDFAIVSVDPCMTFEVLGATPKFIVREADPQITIDARWDDLSKLVKEGERKFESGGNWELYQKNGTNLFYLTSPVFSSIPYAVARIEKDFKRGEVSLHYPYFYKQFPIYPLEYPLDELLFIHFLASGRGAEIHACGVMDSQGQGHLFVGQSGAGKTTMARLWESETGITILSDDRIVLRQMGGRFWMYGTPWHGEGGFASPARAPLTRVYFLRHGRENNGLPEALPLMGAEVVARMMAAGFVPFYNPRALDFTLGFFEQAVKAVPSYELTFVPDERVVDFIQGFED